MRDDLPRTTRPRGRLTRRRLLRTTLMFTGPLLVGCSRQPASSDPNLDLIAWPAEDRWPDAFHQMPEIVQDSYRFAVANRAVLQYMPCFCGCRDVGHTSNFDCYVAEARHDGSVILDPMSFG